MISIIRIPPESIDHFEFDSIDDKLMNLSKINVFVGSNNSGKSRLLRLLFKENQKLDLYPSTIDSKLSNEFRTELDKHFSFLKTNYNSKDTRTFFLEARNLQIRKFSFHLEHVFQFFDKWKGLNKDVPGYLRDAYQAFGNLEKAVDKKLEKLRITNAKKPKKIYIPILRGLRPISFTNEIEGDQDLIVFNDNDVYRLRTGHDYFNGYTDGIITGLSIYQDILKLLTGKEEDRILIRGFEQFLSNEVFLATTTLIPNWSDETLHIKVGDDAQRPIFNLGDGLQTLITILYPIYINKNSDTQFFIEEPEVHLHPLWQRKLFDCLNSDEFSKAQFFISSHSSVFMNSEDISLYAVERKEDVSLVRNVTTNSQKIESLDLLGYKASDLFMSNYIIWVEGASDKIYIRKMISQKDSSLEEGKHYSFMQFSGTGYTDLFLNEHDPELKSVSSMNPNFGIIMDSDRSNLSDSLDSNRTKIVKLFDRIGKFCWVTQLREIENYIPKERFEDAVGNVTSKSGLEIPTGDYDNRFKVVDPKQKESVRPTVRIEDDIFSKISAAHGSLKDISDKELRKTIQKSLDATKKSKVKIGKINLAKEVVKEDITFNEELEEKINELIDNIRKANS